MNKKPEYPYNLLNEIFVDPEIDESFYPCDIIGTLAYVLLETLSEREYNFITARYVCNKTYSVIASENNITPERVRQIITKALRKLRSPNRSNMLKNGIRKTIKNAEIESINIELNEIKKLIRASSYKSEIIAIKNFIMRDANINNDTSDDNVFDAILYNAISEDVLNTDVADLELTVRTHNALYRAGIKTIRDIITTKPEELAKVRNLGIRSFDEIITKLKEYDIDMTAYEKFRASVFNT